VASPACAAATFASPAVNLRPLAFASAWNVQGAGAMAVAEAILGIALPSTPLAAASHGRTSALWLGPASWLVLAEDAPLTRFDERRDALIAAGGALFDVAASRVAWAVAGPGARGVLAAGCPLDLDAREFPRGRCAQSLFGRVTVLLWHRDDGDIAVMAARSFALDVWHGLVTAAGEYAA